ncbi:MAG: hypothetical protein ACF8GE_05590 [Phycisphaerales bacterium JB043]
MVVYLDTYEFEIESYMGAPSFRGMELFVTAMNRDHCSGFLWYDSDVHGVFFNTHEKIEVAMSCSEANLAFQTEIWNPDPLVWEAPVTAITPDYGKVGLLLEQAFMSEFPFEHNREWVLGLMREDFGNEPLKPWPRATASRFHWDLLALEAGVLGIGGSGCFTLAYLPFFCRSRLRARRGCCRSCGYLLEGNVSGVCPECGKSTET